MKWWLLGQLRTSHWEDLKYGEMVNVFLLKDVQSTLQIEHPCKNLDGLPNRKKKKKEIKIKLKASSLIYKARKKRNTDIQFHHVCPATEVSSREMLMTNYCPKELSSAPSYLKSGYSCNNTMHYWEDTWGCKYTAPTVAATPLCQK